MFIKGTVQDFLLRLLVITLDGLMKVFVSVYLQIIFGIFSVFSSFLLGYSP